MTKIDFEDFPPRTRITTQYGNRGIVFPNGAFLDSDPGAKSGTRVLRAGSLSSEFHTGPMIMQFTSPQARVKFFAGGSSQPVGGVLRAFDAAGVLVGQDGPKTVTPNAFTTPFEISLASAVITRLELDMELTVAAVFEAIDDLEFEGEAPDPEPTEPPVVAITAPSDASDLDTSNIVIQGAVIGPGLFPRISLHLARAQHPGSQAPGMRFTTNLVGTGNTRTFSIATGIGLGPHILTVEAENIANMTGSHTIRFTNLPAAIRARHTAEGGTATFGALQYATVDQQSALAIYEHGIVSEREGATFIVEGGIVEKWLALTTSFDVPGRLGGPISEASALPGGGSFQDFARGRIFDGLPTGAHFVPSVFVQAIDALGGQSGFGIPIADPTDSIGVMRTWLFQQFIRPDQPHLLPSTLEIRGTPPKLCVERQGGDLSLFEDLALGPTTPTLWQEFDCDDNLGPCRIVLPEPGTPLENAGLRFCGDVAWEDFNPLGGSFDAGSFAGPGIPPAWVPVRGQNDLTPILGIVAASHKAGSDFPLVHTHHGGPPNFVSDWNVHVRPLRGFEHLFADNRDTVELEFEAYYAQAFFANPELGHPVAGDLLFASGRWIIDCGHRPFNSEIHPPAVMAHMRNASNGTARTEARIWVNGFYSGVPVEFDIHPPPRPSPDATLNVVKPRDSDAALGVTIEFSMEPVVSPTHIRLRLSAPLRQNKVTGLGEMQWEPGRAYYGRWEVFWSD